MIKDRKNIIGFIGLGLMGAGLVGCLKRNGYSIVGYDKDPERINFVSDYLDFPADSPKAVCERSTVIHLCVSSTKEVMNIIFGENGIIEASCEGKIIVDHSTTGVNETRDVAVRLRKKMAIGWVDAPVSGGPDKAAAGTLAMMVGGRNKDVQKVSKVLEILSSSLTHFGPVGSGQVAKMVNQVLVLNNIVIIAEATALAEAGGIDVNKIPKALRHGHAGSNLLMDILPRMADRNFAPKGYAKQVLKDLEMIINLAKELRVPAFNSSHSAELFRLLNVQGHENLDSSAIFKLYDKT